MYIIPEKYRCTKPGCYEHKMSIGPDPKSPLTRHVNLNDDLTSTISRSLIYGNLCFYHNSLILQEKFDKELPEKWEEKIKVSQEWN